MESNFIETFPKFFPGYSRLHCSIGFSDMPIYNSAVKILHAYSMSRILSKHNLIC